MMFQGIYTPVITVFGRSGVDYKAQGRLVERLISAGVDGILFCGSIGEFHAMTLQQKKEYFAWAARSVNKRVHALAGTGGVCTQDVLELTDYAAKAGMDGAVVMSPYYFRLDDESLYRFFTEIASVGLPLMLYNFPDRTGISLSPALVQKLADNPVIAGIKDTVDTISHTREVIAAVKPVRPEFSVLSGFDEYLIPNLMAGGDGILTGMTNVAPQVFVALRQAYLRGDFAAVVNLQAVVNKLMELYPATPLFISAIKEAVAQLVPGTPTAMLAPAAQAVGSQKEKIAKILHEAGLR